MYMNTKTVRNAVIGALSISFVASWSFLLSDIGVAKKNIPNNMNTEDMPSKHAIWTASALRTSRF